MDHPNAIYFVIAANAWLTLWGFLFLMGAFGKGPYGSKFESPKIMKSRKFKALIGLPAFAIGLYAVIWSLYSLSVA